MRSSLSCTCILLLVLAGGCATRRSEPITASVPKGNAVQRGSILYDRYCQSCHPAGEAGLGPALNSLHVPGFVKRFQVRHGLGAMPAFKKDEITNDQLHDIIQYLKSLQKQ